MTEAHDKTLQRRRRRRRQMDALRARAVVLAAAWKQAKRDRETLAAWIEAHGARVDRSRDGRWAVRP